MDDTWLKVQIPLDSVIDSDMADMLRPVSDPALVFNRQALQGGYLPTSVRFEKNGWFCGIYGYDYDIVSASSFQDIEKQMPLLQVERRQTYVSIAYIVKSDEDNGDQVNFVYYPMTRVLSYASSQEPSIEWVPDDDGFLTIVKVSGKTHDFGNDYTFYIDMSSALDGSGSPGVAKENDWVVVDPEGVDFDYDGNPDQPNSILFDQRRYVYSYTVYDKDQSFDDSLTLQYAMPFYIGSEVHELSFSNKKFTYGDTDIVTVNALDWPGASIEVESPSIEIDTSCAIAGADGCLCAVDIAGSICLEVEDSVSAMTETYYVDIDISTCLCSQASIGNTASATVMKDGCSVTVPLVAAGFLCLSAACPYKSESLLRTGQNVYAECISGAVPVWSAQTIWLVRIFGDDIFYCGQNADKAGIVATFVPQQAFATCCCYYGAGDISICSDECWCSKCAGYCTECHADYNGGIASGDKQYYCTVYGNKQYSWVDPLSQEHLFSSNGVFAISNVNQCSACPGFSQCVSVCIPLVYGCTQQSVNTQVCLLLDTTNDSAQVCPSAIGCVLSVVADPDGFSTGSFGACTPFAPIPGSVPQFIVHKPYNAPVCNSSWAKGFLNCVLSKIGACRANCCVGFTICDSLRNFSQPVYCYWSNNNQFKANMQITPITVVYPTAGWFQSYLSFKGVQDANCVCRDCLDLPSLDMFCIDTPYCCKSASDTCKLTLVCSYSATSTILVPSDFCLGGKIVIQTSDGCPGCPGQDSWWQKQEGADCVCYCIGAGGAGGSSGVGLCVCYTFVSCSSTMGCCILCGTCVVPPGAGGAGGLPGIVAAYPSECCQELQPVSETWTQGDSPINYSSTCCNVLAGNSGSQGGLGSRVEIPLTVPECAWYGLLAICVSQMPGTAGSSGSSGFCGEACWSEASGNWSSPEIALCCVYGGDGANVSACSDCCCHAGQQLQDVYVSHFGADGNLIEIEAMQAASCEMSCCNLWQGCGYTVCNGCPGYGADECFCESSANAPCVYVYKYECCTNWEYDVVNLQNELNCFGIHLCCNCIKLSNFLMCCSTQCCIEARAIELVPYLSDGYIYIANSIDAIPAWSTSLALTKKDYWCHSNEKNYTAQFKHAYACSGSVTGSYPYGACIVVQSSKGCNATDSRGGDSGMGVCVTGCYEVADCNDPRYGNCYPFEVVVPGGAGGGAGGNGGTPAVYHGYAYDQNPYEAYCQVFMTPYGKRGANGAGALGCRLELSFLNCPLHNVQVCFVCCAASSKKGADSPFNTALCSIYDGCKGCRGKNGCMPPYPYEPWYMNITEITQAPGQGQEGCAGGKGRVACASCVCSLRSYGSEESEAYVCVYEYKPDTPAAPWPMSNDSAKATRLGCDCGMTPQLYIPVAMPYVDRLVDVSVATSHDSCHNLATLCNASAKGTEISFTGCDGCCYVSPGCWTRDTGIDNGDYIDLHVGIKHGDCFGCCSFDYSLCYNVGSKAFSLQAYDTSYEPASSMLVPNFVCGSTSLGGYSGCDANCPGQVGYTTNEANTCFDVAVCSSMTSTEPLTTVKWSGKYKLCTRLALPYITNCDECGQLCRCGYVTSYAKGVYSICYNCSDIVTVDECQSSAMSQVYFACIASECATCCCCPGFACVCVCGADYDCGTFTLQGVYKNKGTECLCLKCICNGCLAFKYDGCCDTSRLCLQCIVDSKTMLDITSTNVNCSVHNSDGTDNTNETKIASIELNSEYQIVKQKWDTTIQTENIWWLDSEHMMELTCDKLAVLEKEYDEVTGEPMLDDWDGNKWAVSKEFMRSDIIDSTVLRYGVSSVYGSTASDDGGALFWTITAPSSSTFRLTVYNPLNSMQREFTHEFKIKEIDYGQPVSIDLDELSVYTALDSHALISQADISSTRVGWHFIIGIHLDSCLRQWSFVFRTYDWQLMRKIAGYGYVAPNGSLTGGQFPEQHVSQLHGFIGAVKFVNDLDKYHNDSVDGEFVMSGAYGTQEQQWYLYKSVKKICSHFMFSETADVKNGKQSSAVPFTCKWLPVQSTYSAKYSSPSFMLNRITGFLPEPTSLGKIFDFGVGAVNSLVDVLTAIAAPPLWFLNICWIKFGFLQQTVGQFAYTYKTTDRDIDVDKNSIDINAANQEAAGNKDPLQALLDTYKNNASVLTRDSLSFDKQEFEQTCTTKSDSNQGISSFWLSLLQSGIGALAGAAASTVQSVMNGALGKTTPTDVARVFSQFAIENALNAASTSLGANAVDNIMLASKVTAVKTLDMFYSTSSNSNMYAGPGYVCHNFIGYAVAQSMSNRLVAGTQSSMFTALYALSVLFHQFKTLILRCVSGLMEKLAESLDGGAMYALGSGTTFGNFAAMAMRGGAFVTQKMIDLDEMFLNAAPELLKSICPDFPHPKFSMVPGLSQHNIDIEAKHYYGSKHCLFMWPCFGCESPYFTKEKVEAVIKDVPVKIDFTPQNNNVMRIGSSNGINTLHTQSIANVTDKSNDAFKKSLYDYVHSHYIYAKGSSEVDNLPPDMAVVEGTSSFLPTVPFKNENIDIDSSFTIPPIQDYMLDSEWQIGKTAGPTGVLWTSVKDTKIIDGDTSNIVITDDAALIASTYVAVEVKKQIEADYIRPVAVTPNALAWNMTGLNVSYDSEMKHGFDGVGYRLVHWKGTSGMGTEYLTLEYCFFDNDHLKRSNKLQPNRFWGSFTSLPTVANKADFNDSLYHQFEIDAKGIGTEQLTPSENKNTMRNAIPLFTEQLCTMPAVVKALSSYRLDVVHGITSLATQGRTTQGRYKLPKSIDFNINKHLYRATDEYVNELNEQGLPVGEVVAKMGLEFIGATPTQAFFYSDATRAYYSFVGANTITKQDVWNRFKDIKDGKWDFVNQQVVFQCIGNMSRLMDNVDDNDNSLVDNIFIGTMSGEKPGITGEITPPNTAVFDNESWFKTYSFSGGVAFQGPNRYIVNRFIVLDYMIDDIVANKGKWKKVSRNMFNPYRTYSESFKAVNDRVGDTNDYTYTRAANFNTGETYYYKDSNGLWKRAYALTEEKFDEGEYYTRELEDVVEGWTHNPFLLATAPLGVDEDTDCLFEWQLTFTWTDEMDKLYGQNDYVCVNIMAQTMCPGGKKRCEPTHLFLHKSLFTHSENSGYYSFKFSSRNGAGNREQLFIWSDGYIAMTSLSLSYKVVTARRTSPLAVEQIDVQEMSEF